MFYASNAVVGSASEQCSLYNCTLARAHTSWDERTQEDLEPTYIFL